MISLLSSPTSQQAKNVTRSIPSTKSGTGAILHLQLVLENPKGNEGLTTLQHLIHHHPPSTLKLTRIAGGRQEANIRGSTTQTLHWHPILKLKLMRKAGQGGQGASIRGIDGDQWIPCALILKLMKKKTEGTLPRESIGGDETTRSHHLGTRNLLGLKMKVGAVKAENIKTSDSMQI